MRRSKLLRFLYLGCLLTFLTASCSQTPAGRVTAPAAPTKTSPPEPTLPALQTSSPPAPSQTPSQAPIPTPTTSPRARSTLLLAHYMPWYQTEAVSGYWGWHWTMNHFDPARGELASLFTPLTGAYDSSDPDLLEYQLALMKLSGIDGVIVDWYGTADFWDYAALHSATQKLFEASRSAGLLFAICYEDQTIRHRLENGDIQPGEEVAVARADLTFLRDNWFRDPAYLKHNGRPVLLVFGPQVFKDAAQWKQIFEGQDPAPLLVSEDTLLWGAAEASYPWPPMWASSDGLLSPRTLQDYLDKFYLYSAEQPFRIGGAFPGFKDIYREAGANPGYGELDPRGGQTWRDTLQTAVNTDPDAIQLITWNDYGEGTQIEPTEEYGYAYLEILQDFKRKHIQPDFAHTAEDLRLPLELFHLRKQRAGDAQAQATLDQVAAALLAGDPSAARAVLTELK